VTAVQWRPGCRCARISWHEFATRCGCSVWPPVNVAAAVVVGGPPQLMPISLGRDSLPSGESP
jgi:hypothetical protein